VEDQTQQKIRELLQTRDLTPATTLVLTNAIYFKGDWASRFDPGDTENSPFWTSTVEKVDVPMMRQTRKFPLAAVDEIRIIELPYVGDTLAMVVLLPKRRDGLAGLEQSLSAEKVNRWLGALSLQSVQVSLPQFTLNWRFDLAGTLAAMGMTDAFRPGKADFSGMTGRRELWIDAVIHQARIDVNEEGTEAAAATAVVMKKGPSIHEFTADHPFLFLIRNRETGSILFVGRVMNPLG
jgi:serpin B